MFTSCTSLTAAPELLATGLEAKCYYGMFSNSTHLQYVKTSMTDQQLNSTVFTSDNWLGNVASTGTYESTNLEFDETQITRSASTIPTGWNVVKPVMLKLTSKQAGSTVALNTNGTPAALHLEMSRNGTTWTPFVVNYTYVIGGNNDYILLRAPAG